MMILSRARILGCFTAALLGVLPGARAITIQFDYSHDDSGFFTLGGNTSRQATLNAAAAVFNSNLTDSLLGITPGGGNTWTAKPFDPSNPNSTLAFVDLTLAANTVLVYIGSTGTFTGGTLAEGGPGGFLVSGNGTFVNTVVGRGQAGALNPTFNARTDFGPWGGTLTFNNTVSWYFDSDPVTNDVPGGQNDFFSVALHELGHLFGVGTAGSWDHWISGSNFIGPQATQQYGGNPPLYLDFSHWDEDTMSRVFNNTGVAQEAAMDPNLTTGTRKYFTALDFGGLVDIGWQVTLVPEPSSWAWLASLGALSLCLVRRRR